MNELIAFGMGVTVGVGLMWAYTRRELKKLDYLQSQVRILAATVADNFMDVEEVRGELKATKARLNELKAYVDATTAPKGGN